MATPSPAPAPPAYTFAFTALLTPLLAAKPSASTHHGPTSLVCKHYLRGLCKKGAACDFAHSYNLRGMPVCAYFARHGNCSNGDECLYAHAAAPPPPCASYATRAASARWGRGAPRRMWKEDVPRPVPKKVLSREEEEREREETERKEREEDEREGERWRERRGGGGGGWKDRGGRGRGGMGWRGRGR
ncbi:hypothetical protein B0A49_01478 [Cryomyces minteri]|uniref:mRNA 3'-end-processing protein n=1 Tax=Cryomyces minteri TaxID=331657 RepID=A0A4U0XS82_9PEZI|nr:hypothetical protein B0A49_01478 [Cryomyces minteri]